MPPNKKVAKMIVKKQGDVGRALYGEGLVKELLIQMTNDFGKGYDERNLRFMKQLYLVYPKWNAVRTELSWTHYRLLLKVDDEQARDFYIKEAIDGNWSTRQLEREINTFFFFGHYHVDRKINDKKTCLYQEIVQLL